MKTRWAFMCVLMVGSVGLVACGGDDDDAADDDTSTETTADDAGNGDSGGDTVDYVIEGLEFTDLSAPAGATIDISNESGAPHTFTADDGAFDADIEADNAATVTAPADAGDYPFHCNIHPNMTATLTVE